MFSVDRWEQAIQRWLERLAETLFDALPIAVGLLFSVFAGLILGRIAGVALTRLLRRLGLDRISDRSGLTVALQKSSLLASPSYMLGVLARWTVFLLILTLALEALDVGEAEGTLGFIIRYIPNLFVALILMVFGVMLSGVVASWLVTTVTQLGLKDLQSLSLLIRYSVILIVALVVLQQLGIETLILSILILVLAGSILIGVAVSLAISTRGIVANLIAGWFVTRQFPVGSSLRLDGADYLVKKHGMMMIQLTRENEIIHVPNRILVDKVLK